jgi:hypothetical protein
VPETTIASISAPAIAWRVSWTGLALAWPLIPWEYAYYGFVLAPLVVFEFGRGLLAFAVPHAVIFDDKGVRFAWGERMFFVPILIRHERTVAWSDFVGVRTSTLSVNGVPHSTLDVTTKTETFRVPDDFLSQPASVIQRAILNHLMGPAVPDPTRGQSFGKPLRLHAKASSVFGAYTFTVFVCGFTIWLAFTTPFYLTYAFAAVSVIVFGSLSVTVTRTWWSNRGLLLTREGMALGPNPESMPLLPWSEVANVRREVTNGKTTGIELRLKDGSDLRVHDLYDVSLLDLAKRMQS